MISVNREGQLGYNQNSYEIEGIEIAKGSGNTTLDRQAMTIVCSSSPSDASPAEVRKRADIQGVVAAFKFTHVDLETHPQTY